MYTTFTAAGTFSVFPGIRIYNINKLFLVRINKISIRPVPGIEQIRFSDFIKLLIKKINMLGCLLHNGKRCKFPSRRRTGNSTVSVPIPLIFAENNTKPVFLNNHPVRIFLAHRRIRHRRAVRTMIISRLVANRTISAATVINR